MNIIKWLHLSNLGSINLNKHGQINQSPNDRIGYAWCFGMLSEVEKANELWWQIEDSDKVFNNFFPVTIKSKIRMATLFLISTKEMGFPGGSDDRESACNAGDLGSIPGSGRSPGEGNDNPLQYSYLENSVNRGVWQATVHGIVNSRIQLSD